VLDKKNNLTQPNAKPNTRKNTCVTFYLQVDEPTTDQVSRVLGGLYKKLIRIKIYKKI